MPRSVNSVASRAKRKKILKQAKGYFGRRKNVYTVAKNAVELGGRMLYDKIFGFICAAGGKSSYMSVMSLANSLMIDFRCYVIPKFVYATKHDFDEEKIKNSEIKERLEELGNELIRVSKALDNN